MAQPEFSGLPAPGAPVFDLDWAAFRAPGSDSALLEVYYRITNPHLSYVRRPPRPGEATGADTGMAKAENYVAAYEITAIVSSSDDRQVATMSARENYSLSSFAETRNPSGFLVNLLQATVPPADLDLTATLTDRIAGSTHTLSRPVDLRPMSGGRWVLGGPEFFDPDAVAPPEPRFHRTGSGLVPNVTRAFSGNTDRVAFYAEVYADAFPAARALRVEVNQRLGHHHLLDTVPLAVGQGVIPVIYRSPLPGFATGEARLHLTVVDSLGRELNEPLETSFWIDWSMSSLVSDNWEEAVDMLVHIAGADELKKLRNTPPDQREAAFTAFWKSKDPTPETEENEWEEEYYRRIRFADLRFSTPLRRGWKTDFGMVYVRYGEPDEIERHPFERGSKPYQIWYYYGQRRRFVFVDAKGNGEYELQYPYDGIVR
ncbi:MAG: GWxTD domain-containing protein [Candidatus Zixiibacteriota bacterium]